MNYDKGILAEILEPIMGKGLIPADPETWKVRRKAIVPGFHKAWLNAMVRYRLLFYFFAAHDQLVRLCFLHHDHRCIISVTVVVTSLLYLSTIHDKA